MTATEFFEGLASRINPERISGMCATYQFNLIGDDAGDCRWVVAIDDGIAQVWQGDAANPDITVTTTASDWIDMVSGKLSGQMAFLSGRLKLQGDVSLALKLQAFLQP
ncbi:MAG TPA: SCP2 sterol-binding domain-containing protein [Candidatus Hydrogenedentes bacterium]|nr:SCP2 sterol-binding domain-containing protein [Candidatus Hydrogenedentota bacterium]HOS02518.1 SCP2 sterol-binding domain-containing protein [Candidatus Hydrogenedentota bacterium]